MTTTSTFHLSACPTRHGGPCRCDELDPIGETVTFTFRHEPGCTGSMIPANLLGPALTCQTCDATVFLTEEHPTASGLTATTETPQSTTRKVLRLVDGERR